MSFWAADDALDQAEDEMLADGTLDTCQRCGAVCLAERIDYSGCPECRSE